MRQTGLQSDCEQWKRVVPAGSDHSTAPRSRTATLCNAQTSAIQSVHFVTLLMLMKAVRTHLEVVAEDLM
jgi:hypothetical protein